MSEELEQLWQYLETGQLDAAFSLLDAMDEMSRDDKIHKIQSYMHVLLIHLIQQAAEHRTTPSWDRTIRNTLFWIPRINRRRKPGAGTSRRTNFRKRWPMSTSMLWTVLRQKRWAGPTLQPAWAAW
jgi:hypothetical protein